MATSQQYNCDNCGRNINSLPVPVVFYIVAGNVNGGGEIDLDPLTEYQREMIAQVTSRQEYCIDCMAGNFAVAPAEVARLKEKRKRERPDTADIDLDDAALQDTKNVGRLRRLGLRANSEA